MLKRLIDHWVYGGALAGVVILALTPILARGWSPALLASFLCLPIYMLHQYEEHDADRFRQFVNAHLGAGRAVLTPLTVFIVNVPGVWGLAAVGFAASTVDAGYGLIGLYLVAVNAVVHIVPAIRTRTYNPGLVTAVVLFVPLGIIGIGAVDAAGGGTILHHAEGLALAIAVHLAIIAAVLWRRHRLSQA
ncbi:MAG: HXXEE domain-containing protein [Ancalomicrobiaceae bacterium]|nr:HXXEE domain-containing protein [Ancalomicrobiaceae bacterium]